MNISALPIILSESPYTVFVMTYSPPLTKTSIIFSSTNISSSAAAGSSGVSKRVSSSVFLPITALLSAVRRRFFISKSYPPTESLSPSSSVALSIYAPLGSETFFVKRFLTSGCGVKRICPFLISQTRGVQNIPIVPFFAGFGIRSHAITVLLPSRSTVLCGA